MTNRLKMLVWVTGLGVIFSASVLLWRQGWLVSASGVSMLLSEASRPRQAKTPEDPCWFMKGRDAINKSRKLSAAFNQMTQRKIYGYPAEIALAEGLRIFNAEEKCVEFRGTLPPLTEDEVVAAIVAGPTYGREEVWERQKKALWDIAVQKKLPRGSLFTAESGACAYGSPLDKRALCVKGQRIYLFLNLNQYPRKSNPLKDDQVVVIRENYFRVERLDTTAP